MSQDYFQPYFQYYRLDGTCYDSDESLRYLMLCAGFSYKDAEEYMKLLRKQASTTPPTEEELKTPWNDSCIE